MILEVSIHWVCFYKRSSQMTMQLIHFLVKNYFSRFYWVLQLLQHCVLWNTNIRIFSLLLCGVVKVVLMYVNWCCHSSVIASCIFFENSKMISKLTSIWGSLEGSYFNWIRIIYNWSGTSELSLKWNDFQLFMIALSSNFCELSKLTVYFPYYFYIIYFNAITNIQFFSNICQFFIFHFCDMNINFCPSFWR